MSPILLFNLYKHHLKTKRIKETAASSRTSSNNILAVIDIIPMLGELTC